MLGGGGAWGGVPEETQSFVEDLSAKERLGNKQPVSSQLCSYNNECLFLVLPGDHHSVPHSSTQRSLINDQGRNSPVCCPSWGPLVLDHRTVEQSVYLTTIFF